VVETGDITEMEILVLLMVWIDPWGDTQFRDFGEEREVGDGQ